MICFHLHSGHKLGAAVASPSGRHPHGPARGPPAEAAGVLALSARAAVVRAGVPGRNGPGRRDAGLGPRAAAAAGALGPEAEAADPAADPDRRIPAAARAAVSPARGPAPGTH